MKWKVYVNGFSNIGGFLMRYLQSPSQAVRAVPSVHDVLDIAIGSCEKEETKQQDSFDQQKGLRKERVGPLSLTISPQALKCFS